MYSSQAWVDLHVCHSVCVWPTALKLGCITNFDMLLVFLVMGFVSLVDDI